MSNHIPRNISQYSNTSQVFYPPEMLIHELTKVFQDIDWKSSLQKYPNSRMIIGHSLERGSNTWILPECSECVMWVISLKVTSAAQALYTSPNRSGLQYNNLPIRVGASALTYTRRHVLYGGKLTYLIILFIYSRTLKSSIPFLNIIYL